MTSASMTSAVRLAAIVAIATFALTGCGGGADTVENAPPPGSRPTSTYNGPQPTSDDIQAFQREFWSNIRTKTCANCHGTGGQSPSFVRDDNVNEAYAAANPLVNRDNPSLSVFVTKVAGGHNCWETNANACADQISRWISAWVGQSSFSGRQIQLTPPPDAAPTSSRQFPADSTLFETHVWPILRANCARCHVSDSPTAQQPYFASDDPAEAYEAAQARMNLDAPERSRLVVRLRDEAHNCWSPTPGGAPNCASNATVMQNAITALRDGISVEPFDTTLLASRALRLVDGTVAAGGNRYDANVIALYEFKTGEGETAFDTSGVEPALHLTLSGSDWGWVGGWGIRLVNGKAQGSTTASRKLRDLITLSGEYSIEAWVVPANVAQEESRIVSYSGSATTRNFMLGQTMYSYDFYARSSETDSNGEPFMTTDADDEDLQATLQHVVATYDPINGRRLYVNGEFTDDEDPVDGGTLGEWDDSFAFVLGNEVNNQEQFEGTFRLVAVHNRALNEAQIVQNFQAGVGQKFYLLFNVSQHVGIQNAYILFEVSEYDSYSYLFDNPRFIVLNGTGTPGAIPVRGMRIGVNGQLPTVGQAYRTLETSVPSAQYTAAEGQVLSSIGTVIAREHGPEDDQFFLTFEVLGENTDVRVEATPDPLPWPLPQPRPPEIGLRTFERINATMAKVTGVSSQTPAIRDTYEQVKQALPTVDSIETFVSAQPVAIAQLSIQYCSALIDNDAMRTAYFPGFNFTAGPAAALGTNGQKDLLINPLLSNMVGVLENQPSFDELKNGAMDQGNSHIGLYQLVTNLSAGGGDATRTRDIAKATCAAVLGSAATLVN